MTIRTNRKLLCSLVVLHSFISLTTSRVLDKDNVMPHVYKASRGRVFEMAKRQLQDHHFGFFITGVFVEMPSSPAFSTRSSVRATAATSASGSASAGMTLPTSEGVVGSTTGDAEALAVAQALINAGVEYVVTSDGIFFEEIPPGVSIGPLPPGVSLEKFQLEDPDAMGSITANENAAATPLSMRALEILSLSHGVPFRAIYSISFIYLQLELDVKLIL